MPMHRTNKTSTPKRGRAGPNVERAYENLIARNRIRSKLAKAARQKQRNG